MADSVHLIAPPAERALRAASQSGSVTQPTVDDMQRELLAICKGRDSYETWARVTGQPTNMRVNEMVRIGKRAAVNDLRKRIHAINPDAALYFGWCPGDYGPTAKREFFAAIKLQGDTPPQGSACDAETAAGTPASNAPDERKTAAPVGREGEA